MKKEYKLWQFDYLGNRLVADYYSEIFHKLLADRPTVDVLEVGCGNARWKNLFKAPARYTGMDIVAREGVDVVASAEKMPFPNDTFDILFSNAVLEHIPDVASAIAEMHRVLRPGGVLVLGTHGVWPLHGEPHDYRRWTPHGLRWECRAFRATEVSQVGGPLANAMILLNCYIRRQQERAAILRLLLAPIVLGNNLLAQLFPGSRSETATLATCFIIQCVK